MDSANWDESYARVLPEINRVVKSGQIQAAKRSQSVYHQWDQAWGLERPGFTIVPEAFAGVAADGQDIINTLSVAPLYMKQAMIRTGNPETATDTGYAYVSMKANTHINDAGRNADRVNMNARTYTDYVRIASPGACSRCIQLIGMSSARTAFLRHPNCKCKSMPVPENGQIGKGIPESPREFFDGLSPAEQNRRFTKAGAEAIREGADISRVVNARRGASGLSYGQRDDFLNGRTRRRLHRTNIGTAHNPHWVYQTQELTSKRSMRRYQYRDGVRLMPESIIKMAGDDKVRMRELLRHYGYIV